MNDGTLEHMHPDFAYVAHLSFSLSLSFSLLMSDYVYCVYSNTNDDTTKSRTHANNTIHAAGRVKGQGHVE